MKLQIKPDTNFTKEIALGSVVTFNQYGTAYIVHVADTEASIKRKREDFSKGDLRGHQLYMLARTDGKKPYQMEPMTQLELQEKVSVLNGKVYSPEEYKLQLVKKY